LRKDPLKEKLARTEALRSLADGEELVAGLCRALADRSNYVVAKAAKIAGSRYVEAVVPALLAAYERLFIDPVRSDSLALGKHAIAQALKDLDHRDPAAFLRGLAYEQFEPVYGGQADVAGGLRATCAHALVGCTIDAWALLERLVERLVDADRTVRVEAARAIGRTGGRESALLLRLKALAGDADAEVLGACFDALLVLEGPVAIAFIEAFAARRDESVVLEALGALAAARLPEAFAAVQRCWIAPRSRDLQRGIVAACAASPLAEAGAFLVTLIATEPGEIATAAVAALAASRHRNELRDVAENAARSNVDGRVTAAFAREFGPAPVRE
jgi:hypothetical protein